MKKSYSSKKMNIGAILIMFLVFIAILTYSYLLKLDLNDTLSLIQIVVLPTSLIISAFILSINTEARELSIELEKIEITNHFIEEFRKIIHNFSFRSKIKREYYKNFPSVQEFINKIKKFERLEFNEDFIRKHLPVDISQSELKKIVVVTDEKTGYDHLNDYINTCLKISANDDFKVRKQFNERIDNYKKLIEEIEQKYEKQFHDLETQLVKDLPAERKRVQDLKYKEVQDLKIKLAHSIRMEDSDLLNDMECLLFNVNFNLLDYNNLYHLIIDFFKGYIDVFYLDLTYSIVAGNEKNRKYYSNIIAFYNKMMDVEKHYISNNANKEKKNKKLF